jgi:hypothetical protein
MAKIDFNLQKYDGEFKAAGMARVRKAAEAIRDAAKDKCKRGTISRGRRRAVIINGRRVDIGDRGEIWTERQIGAMRETIRVVDKDDFDQETGFYADLDEVRIYAGNFATWWAIQMEYGRGGWKGGARPFLRPALHATESKVRDIVEGRDG